MLCEDQFRTQLTPTFKVKTPPATEPVQVTDLESQASMDLIDDGGKGLRFIRAAREMVEAHSGVSLLPTVWQCFLDRFPWYTETYSDRIIQLKRGPVTAVASVIYTNTAGTPTTLSPSVYQTDIVRTPARIMPAFGQAWPVAMSSTLNAVTIEFTAGFTNASAIPQKAIQAILMLAGYWLENPTMSGLIGTDIAMAYQSLTDAVHWEVYDE